MGERSCETGRIPLLTLRGIMGAHKVASSAETERLAKGSTETTGDDKQFIDCLRRSDGSQGFPTSHMRARYARIILYGANFTAIHRNETKTKNC